MKKITKLTLLLVAFSSLSFAHPTKLADMTIRQLFTANKKLFAGAALAVPTTIVAYKIYQSRSAEAQLGRAIGRAIADKQNAAWDKAIADYQEKLKRDKPWELDRVFKK